RELDGGEEVAEADAEADEAAGLGVPALDGIEEDEGGVERVGGELALAVEVFEAAAGAEVDVVDVGVAVEADEEREIEAEAADAGGELVVALGQEAGGAEGEAERGRVEG